MGTWDVGAFDNDTAADFGGDLDEVAPRSAVEIPPKPSSARSPALTRPQLLILGRHDQAGRLRTVGRTTTLRPDAACEVAEHLAAAGPGHPWEGVRFAASCGSRDVLDATLVRPDLVAEISADRAVDRGGVWCHALRFKRLRRPMVG
ncbi:DUF4259 domain-containing protein [Streptomyces sp. H27-H1]|uniref:DUF4259 domain-containing protein n=1 Tax=Streptomyces sp. H27-H1 TaxID=2996461 RepID=UPI0022704A7C|nr:DUF4259 domain-containing protein [Streptomyces sp. H27-H1]MCY0927903.1 DUF4259 domain-containing protein [Streptomyces sp. H27-H1]